MPRSKLPIGLHSFREVREKGLHYVDKTAFIEQLLDDGKHFFLSRPRRFGKTLFIDTLKELFEGNEKLFKGLAIYDRWDWSDKIPVIHLSFGGSYFDSPEVLPRHTATLLNRLEQYLGLQTSHSAPEDRFDEIIRASYKKCGKRVVILVDEYDKPITDALDNQDVARTNRSFLRALYSVIKECDSLIHFSFITGVSKFSKVSLFSGLNHLIDLTIDPNYSSICGYTDSDLDRVFSAELEGLDRDEIRDWYNGYSWLGNEKVYNPFAILQLLRSRRFLDHWFEVGSPSFLINTLFRRKVSSINLENMLASSSLLTGFDVNLIEPAALLFQTGYLTIDHEEIIAGETYYHLTFPNREVRLGLHHSLLDHIVGDTSTRQSHSVRLNELIIANDLDGLHRLFQSFYASIPYEWFMNNDIANYEGFYASVFYSYFAGLGFELAIEESTSSGRLDMALKFEDRVYIFEFKVIEQAGEGTAMTQLREKAYEDKYRAVHERVYLIAVEFSSESRNIVSFKVEQA